VRRMLNSNPTAIAWGSFAFLSNDTDRRLWGTIPRSVLADVIAFSPGETSCETFSASPSAEREAQPLHTVMSSNSLDNQRQSVAYGSFLTDDVHVDVEPTDEKIALLAEYDPATGHRNVDEGPFVVSSKAPFWKVATYFRMLGLSSMYVIDDGRTVGLLTKAQVIQFTFAIEDRIKVEKEEKKEQEREVARLVALARISSAGRMRSTGRGTSARMASRFSQQDLVNMATPAPRRHATG
jgi:hypothetical protein